MPIVATPEDITPKERLAEVAALLARDAVRLRGRQCKIPGKRKWRKSQRLLT